MIKLKSIELLRFPLAILVIIEHVFGSSIVTIKGSVYNPLDYEYYNAALPFIEAFCDGISVPIFYFISGYLFFRSGTLSTESYIRKIKRRIRTLLIPYLIWNLIVLNIEIFKFQIPKVSNILSYSNWELNLSLSTILSCFWEYGNNIYTLYAENGTSILSASTTPYPINGPLWFIRDLMIVVIFTPIIYYTLKKIKYFLLILLGLLWLIPSSAQIMPEHIKLLSIAFFFFTLGAYQSLYKKDEELFDTKWKKHSWIIYSVFALLTAYFTIKNNILAADICREIRIIGALIVAFSITDWIIKKYNLKTSDYLSTASFFIYASHSLIYMRATKLLFLLIKPDNNVGIFIVYIGSILLTILILLSTFSFLSKFMPKLNLLLTGRKS